MQYKTDKDYMKHNHVLVRCVYHVNLMYNCTRDVTITGLMINHDKIPDG